MCIVHSALQDATTPYTNRCEKLIMRQALFIFLLNVAPPTFSQVDSISNELIPLSFDSLQLSVWDVHTKEMSLPGQEKEYEKELERITLSEDDQKILVANLLDPRSYDQTRALLYHYNLVFEIYSKRMISARIEISTMTGNVGIENKIEGGYFRNNCSEQFGIVLMNLLSNNDLMELFDELDLEGIAAYKE